MEFNRLGDEREPLPPRRVSRQPAAGAGASAGAGADAGAGAGAGAPARHRAGSSLRAEVSVIDLTEEPDSPEDVRVLPNANRARARYPQHRNPRRQMSFGNRTPSLTRSDGSLLGAAPAQVIDLTIDDDAPPGPPPAPFWGGAPANRAQAPRLTFPRARTAMEEAEHEMGALFGMMRRFTGGMNPLGPGIGFLHRLGGALGQQPQEVDVQYLGGNNHAHNHDNPLGNNLPNFNYRANGYNNPGSPKPVHVSPPPAREGFSRGTGEELAFVCPSCEDELTYDPDEEEKHPAKKARTKKDREEHHFWAVKECGHVYCRACYENRRTKTKTTFRAVENPPRKLLCAVEDCNSDVNTKAAWVGLFL
ncbi:hypothetical protein B0T25DRAFT_466747 [Lasiosphaeria hispida]|uniref:Cell cycle control protein n=1 Tax=Lasiosphaeria hispida TaxID=260671 RepID=A0AAJ0M7S0_9PEZI|nr:hypothetical protein B0T25DRAFT_466747 [Lasiosphaeria hispida]